jgi:hypothetical protein
VGAFRIPLNTPLRNEGANLEKRETVVSYLDLRIKSTFRANIEGEPTPMPVELGLSAARAVAGQLPFIRPGTRQVQIALTDWVVDAKRREHYLLFNRADASLPDIPLRHFRTGESRWAGKELEEGIDLSSHVLIRLPRDQTKPALTMLTGGSSLRTEDIPRMLNRLLKEAERLDSYSGLFLRDHPNGSSERVRLHSKFEVDAHPSADLSLLLRGGALTGIDLISDGDEELDEEHRLMITETEFKVVPTQPGASLTLTVLKNAIGKAPAKIDRVRVHYKQGEDATKAKLLLMQNLEAAFARKVTMRTAFAITPRYERVSMEMVDSMRTQLQHDGL